MQLTNLTYEKQKMLGHFIESNFGIQMPDSKRQLMINRLSKRVRELKLASFDEYCELVLDQKKGSQEIINMINVISTNKTDFFRESKNLEYFCHQIVPELTGSSEPKQTLRVWSAACSSGEEPYSIAMLLERYHSWQAAGYTILATDISTTALQKAYLGIYPNSQLDTIPPELSSRFTMRPLDVQKKVFRISPGIRGKVKFKRLNLIESEYKLKHLFDVVFCRNVLIYFNDQNKTQVIQRLYSSLRPGGYLIIGNSESLIGINSNLKSIAPGIYKKS